VDVKLVLAALAAAATVTAANAAGTHAPLVASSGPAWSPDGSELAYVVDTATRSDVYVRTLATGASLNLTGSEPYLGHDLPAWSHDGHHLAYVTAFGGFYDAKYVYSVISADGSGAHPVGATPTIGRPCFSASGSWLLFDGFDVVDSARTSGGDQRDIVSGAGGPVCSPRADRVAVDVNTRDNGDVWTMSPTGRKPRRLTTANGWDNPLAWSRDGRRILFETEREIVGKKPSPKRDVAVYVMDADGRHQRRVVYGRFGDLAPGGKRLVYVTPRGAVVATGLDGRHAHVLAAHGEDPKWSPSGRWIAFVLRVPEPGHSAPVIAQLELVHPDGSGLHAVKPF
jgi:Tol biopolymer transport system component